MSWFETKEQVFQYVRDIVDDPYIDNWRFAYADDPQMMREYYEKKRKGCCGSFDQCYEVGGRLAWVGCNFGH